MNSRPSAAPEVMLRKTSVEAWTAAPRCPQPLRQLPLQRMEGFVFQSS